jgi:hypothetical protein
MKGSEVRWLPLGISAGLALSYGIPFLPEHVHQGLPVLLIVLGIIGYVLASEDTRK